MSTDHPVKTVGSLAQDKWSPKHYFTFLTFYRVMPVLIETGGRPCFVHSTNSEALLLLTQFPNDGTPGVPKREGNSASNICNF
jgi:hypothetical protein